MLFLSRAFPQSFSSVVFCFADLVKAFDFDTIPREAARWDLRKATVWLWLVNAVGSV